MYSGGYYLIKEPFIKFSKYENTSALRRPASDHVLFACDVLGKTPLRVNTFILDLIQYMRETKETLPQKLLNVMPSPEITLPSRMSDEVWDGLTKAEKREHKSILAKIHTKNNKSGGQREAFIRKVNMAHELRNKVFWLPHALDFRGRMYAQPQDLNFLNNDLSRGLLMFAEGKPFGEEGYKWLAVRLANDFGQDKLPFDERIKWVEKNSDLILDSAKDPIDGEKFWCEADEPFQFLSACYEFARIDKEGFNAINHIPINVDATASGIQHLSSWIRDPLSAKVVNMTSEEKRFDIYGVQSEIVNSLIAKDLDKIESAKNCHGQITRKTIKTQIMTFPYGVTSEGLLRQFENDGHIDHLEGDRNTNARYLRDKVVQSLGDALDKPMQLMNYFKEVAGALAEHNIPLEFTSPMGLKVRQAYYKLNRKEIKTLLGKAVLWKEEPAMGLDIHKQKQASSPNVIHAYDASHLQAVLLKGATLENPITSWACVHDSIGVHASEVNKVNKLIREEFVRIYSQPVLKDFHENMSRHKVKLPDPPTLGTFDINEVLRAPYFFS